MKLNNLILSNDQSAVVRILILSGIAWLPLVMLTLIDGTFINAEITIPFIEDVVPFVRGLIVIPMLILADNLIEPMIARTTQYIQSSGIVPEAEKNSLSTAEESMANLMNNKWVQLILVMLALMFSFFLQSDYAEMWDEREVTSWILHQDNGVVDETLAGTWFLLITSPLVLFLLYRWLWRFVVWSIFLYRVSRLKLELYASHTDLSGGLGMIGEGQVLFGIVFLIMATLVSSELAGNMLYEGEKLFGAKQLVFVFILISTIVIVMPMLFFSKKLLILKHKALVEYGTLQNQVSKDFHKHWIKDEANDLVDSMQPSAMADYSSVYENVSNIRLVPLNPKMLVVLAAVLLLPFMPLVLIESSIWDILQKIGGSLV